MTDESASPDVSARLHLASADDRRDILNDLMAAHPDGRLILIGAMESRNNLRGLPFPGGKLRGATLAFADLHKADFSNSNLSQADMRHAALEGANLRRADLTEVDLTDANLGEADLGESLLEDAKLERASLRFADLRDAVLESANLKDADFWGAILAKADLNQVSARAAHFGEAVADAADFSKADLRDADFANAVLVGALFVGADLRGASLRGAKLSGADFSGAALQGVDLSQCELQGAFWEGAILDHTRLGQDQIGRVGEEVARNPSGAAGAYLILERNFGALGDSSAASWAYLKRRRMQKMAALADARKAVSESRLVSALGHSATFIGDTLVEWICDYGESLLRTFSTLIGVYLAFIVIYGVSDGVVRVTILPQGQLLSVTHRLTDLAVYSIMAMTTSGLADGVLKPANLWISFLGGLQILIGIFLTGLLGFVAGNRIRR